MKPTISIAFKILMLVLMMHTFSAKAQFPLQNLLLCSVTLSYEVWDINTCNVCLSGTVTINQGGTTILPTSTWPCTQMQDICIVITDIGGVAPPSNHASLSTCHVVTPFGQSGSANAVCQNPNFNAFLTGTGWSITP